MSDNDCNDETEVFVTDKVLEDILSGITGTPISLVTKVNSMTTEQVAAGGAFTVDIEINSTFTVVGNFDAGVVLVFRGGEGGAVTIPDTFVPMGLITTMTSLPITVPPTVDPGNAMIIARPAARNRANGAVTPLGGLRRFRVANLKIT